VKEQVAADFFKKKTNQNPGSKCFAMVSWTICNRWPCCLKLHWSNFQSECRVHACWVLIGSKEGLSSYAQKDHRNSNHSS